ncbi:MAG TPA: phosphoribosylglycinamide formyltransferase [Alphaproteobacteria bacterium]|jgi:phosphoribosylglycinamide formyltransferase-1|nr:phosphoribosylglycinamide formyltransferase [Alphaproteobacteria bacterium]
MAKLKLGVLISGRGSNLQALIDAAAASSYPAEIALVISNKADAGGLARAEAAGIATQVIPHKEFASREAFDAALDQALRDAGVGLVCLAGFMRLLTPGFSQGWHDRLINIHPSLLPSFKGLDSHAQALKAGVRFSGCTVHFVRPEMDAGPIILQAAVPVHDGDDEDGLAARILEAEHKSYPLAVRLIAEGRIEVVDEIVRVRNGDFAAAALLNPAG